MMTCLAQEDDELPDVDDALPGIDVEFSDEYLPKKMTKYLI